QAFIDALRQIFRTTIRDPTARAWASETAFGRNHQSFRIRMERFCDEKLARFGAVGIGRVDQVHAKIARAPQNFLCVLAIGRPTPDPLARYAHRAEAESIHGKIAAE